jgi:hypothetical protein
VEVQRILNTEHPDLKISITELKDWVHIEEYSPVISVPCMVVNEKLVFVGRIPPREEVLGWVRSALDE